MRLVVLSEQGDGLALLAGAASPTDTVDVIFDRERELAHVRILVSIPAMDKGHWNLPSR